MTQDHPRGTTPSKRRLAAEAAVASLLGLFPLVMRAISEQASMSASVPVLDLACRVTFVLEWVTCPGMLLARMLGGVDEVGITIGFIANMALFGAA